MPAERRTIVSEPEDEAEMRRGGAAEGPALPKKVKLELEVGVMAQQPAGGYDIMPSEHKSEFNAERSEPTDVEEWRGGEAVKVMKVEIEIIPVAQQPPYINSKMGSPEQKADSEPEQTGDKASSQNKQLECDDRAKIFIDHRGSHSSNKNCNSGSSSDEEVRKYVCAECGKIFTESSYLTKHMRTHTGEKPYKCTECEKCFSTSANLFTHKRTHTGVRPYLCTDCHKAFTSSSNLRRHIRSHTGERRFECNECHKKFDASSLLRAHMRTHTGERPYKCSECDKTFINVSTLCGHTKTHRGEKPFQCSYCQKSFGTSSNFRRHMEIHTEQFYECSVCNKIFTTSDNLRRHKKTHIKKNLQV